MRKRTKALISRLISMMLIMIFVIGDVSSIAAATGADAGQASACYCQAEIPQFRQIKIPQKT